MRVACQRVTCLSKRCGKVSDIEMVLDAPIKVVSAMLKAARCPRCGGKLGFGGENADKPETATSLAERIRWWRDRGDTGTSSLTIHAVLSGGYAPPARGFGQIGATPFDPDDFRRCKLLLDLIPEWRGRLKEVAVRYPAWGPLVRDWATVDAMFMFEESSGVAPKTFHLMETLIAEGERQSNV